jgi:uncharacterized protein with PIN domain
MPKKPKKISPNKTRCPGCGGWREKYIQEHRNEVLVDNVTRQMSVQRAKTSTLICPNCGVVFVPKKSLELMNEIAFGEKRKILTPKEAGLGLIN